MSSILDLLKSRELLENATVEHLPAGNYRVYSGVDPSGDCLHLGHLTQIIVLRWFQRLGHTPVLLFGGATGMIGDPSGKSKERNLLDEMTVRHNVRQIETLARRLLPSIGGLPEPVFVNNYDWFSKIHFIDFLRDVGKHFRLGAMLAKESVQSRLLSEEGISFTEFCYQTLQAYDFYHLFEQHQAAIQCGGSDQWGNITAGCDLIARKSQRKEQPAGLVWPLLLRSDGRKFGKSEEGAIWLDPHKLSPYRFYQYALATADNDVIRFMKRLTFMELEEIERYRRGLEEGIDPPNTAQRRYAEELTRFVHGEEGLAAALAATGAAHPGSSSRFESDQLALLQTQLPCFELAKEQLLGMRLVDLMAASGLVASRAAARRLIENQGAYLNQERLSDLQRIVQESDLIGGQWVVLSAGKKKRVLVKMAQASPGVA